MISIDQHHFLFEKAKDHCVYIQPGWARCICGESMYGETYITKYRRIMGKLFEFGAADKTQKKSLWDMGERIQQKNDWKLKILKEVLFISLYKC